MDLRNWMKCEAGKDPICKTRKGSRHNGGDLLPTGSLSRNNLASDGNRKHTRTRWRYCSGYYQRFIVMAHIPTAVTYAADTILSALYVLTHLTHTPIHILKQNNNLWAALSLSPSYIWETRAQRDDGVHAESQLTRAGTRIQTQTICLHSPYSTLENLLPLC